MLTFVRSGKSSIQRVVFGKMPPNDTLYLESTTKIQKEDITQVVHCKFHVFYALLLIITKRVGAHSLISRSGIFRARSTFLIWPMTHRKSLARSVR